MDPHPVSEWTRSASSSLAWTLNDDFYPQAQPNSPRAVGSEQHPAHSHWRAEPLPAAHSRCGSLRGCTWLRYCFTSVPGDNSRILQKRRWEKKKTGKHGKSTMHLFHRRTVPTLGCAGWLHSLCLHSQEPGILPPSTEQL